MDLRESLKMCDVGDVFCPANITKSHDQITKGVAHILSQGTLPMIMGGDHSIGYPMRARRGPVRGGECRHHPSGPAHRHAGKGHGRDHAHLSVVPRNQYPELPADESGASGHRRMAGAAAGVKKGRERGSTVLTIHDIERIGIDKTIEIALEVAWKGASAVYLSFDVDSVDAGFVPGTGWPEPGGFLPREALELLNGVAKEGIAAMEAWRFRRRTTSPTSPR